ncbi:FAD-binding oxidoreductase [Georgenia sp. AZ-5]|uniref:FAD-binding oxidoreductase n=1 Tax=Georgenia sp. AZ-5 TaxID=3367526 RepID=UPI003753F6A9
MSQIPGTTPVLVRGGPRWDGAAPDPRAARVLAALRRELPADRVRADADTLAAYAGDASGLLPAGPPAAVAAPRTVPEVQAVMRIATALRAPVVVRGAGSGLAGGATASPGGIVLTTEALDRILEIRPEDELAVVEAGVVTAALDRAVTPHGLRYAPDPASAEYSTIGGNIATNAGGLRCCKYGVTRESVLALDVVLADGTLMRVGHRTIKGVTGLDLVGLLVGSEGTLGVVVSATLRLRPLPVATETMVAFADSLAAVGGAVEAITRAHVQPSAVELLDEASLRSIDDNRGTDLASRGRAMLLVQTDGHGAAAEMAELERVVAAAGVSARRVHGAEAEHYVELRRSGRGSRRDAWRLGEDVAVPRSRLVEMIGAIEDIGARYRVDVGCVAHAGDGNLHVGLSRPMRPGEAEPPAAVHAAADQVVRTALDLGGTVTGEHGVGTLKRPWLTTELGERQLDLQRAVKAAFDPLGILAPDSFLAVEKGPR